MDDLTFTSMGISTARAKFPTDLKMGFFKSLDREFIKVFLICIVVLYPLFLIGAFRKMPKEPTMEEMEDLQARYAKLVLNKEMVKEEEEQEEPKQAEQVQEKKKKKDIDRKKESVAQKRARKEASQAQRAKQREAMKKQIENIGVFAELTAIGGTASPAGAVKDLIGDMDAAASLSNLDLTSSSFVQKKAEKIALRERRGERSKGGTIETSGLSKARGTTLKSTGKVELRNVDKIEGEAKGDASRSMKALNSVLRKYQPRLRRVYEKYLKRNPDLSGKIIIKFTIEADGSVSNIVVIKSDFNNKSLEKDLARRIKRIKFPSASGKITIEWPLIFSAG
jgi:outer membrane biosynthesis protein TonB